MKTVWQIQNNGLSPAFCALKAGLHKQSMIFRKQGEAEWQNK
ncbi:MAG: hypothetical protein Q4E21_04245 [Clostridia bacterium]|nr:hypothetical protein [Clostridia bacterium]